MHCTLCRRNTYSTQKRTHSTLRYPTWRPHALLHDDNLDDVALARLLPRRWLHNNTIRRLAIPPTRRPKHAPVNSKSKNHAFRHLSKVPFNPGTKTDISHARSSGLGSQQPESNLFHRITACTKYIRIRVRRLPLLH